MRSASIRAAPFSTVTAPRYTGWIPLSRKRATILKITSSLTFSGSCSDNLIIRVHLFKVIIVIIMTIVKIVITLIIAVIVNF